MNSFSFDVVIVGAGPAGCACAICLADSGLNIAVVDKEKFPREKVCGDGLTIDVVNQLGWISEQLKKDFIEFGKKLEINGLQVFSSKGDKMEVFLKDYISDKKMYTCKRIDFDNFLFKHLKKYKNIKVFEQNQINDVSIEPDKIVAESQKYKFESKILIAADGQNSVISRKIIEKKEGRKKHSGYSLRCYYKNVTGLHPENTLELHFLKNIPYGYFWIFKLPDNQVNVGIGLPSGIISKRKMNLKTILDNIITDHPEISPRFKNAVLIDKIEGGKIMGSAYRNKSLSDERVLLTGDSAYLANPFSGEGVGSAIRSGRIAAGHIIKAFSEQKFDAKFNKLYDREINDKILKESKAYFLVQHLFGNPGVKSFLIKKYNKNSFFRFFVIECYKNYKKIYGLLNPVTVFRILRK